MRNEWFAPKWLWLKRFAIAGFAGLAVICVGVVAELPAIAAIGIITVVPLIFWLAFIPVLHWKDRYIGGRSGVWGGFLAFETSGWSKLFYWFRHVLPDWRRAGRYKDAS